MVTFEEEDDDDALVQGGWGLKPGQIAFAVLVSGCSAPISRKPDQS